MKKLFFTLCALCVSVSTWALQSGATAWTDSNRGEVYQDANSTGLYFYISGTDAVLTWSDASTSNYSSLTSLTIPELVVYDGVSYPVTKVGDYAFYDAATIEGEVVIPANILNLGISAFENCTNISAVTIEYSETAITETNNQLYGCSFYGCSGIKTITVNRDISVQRDSDTNQAYRVAPFTSLTGVTTVDFGVEVTKVPRNMCYGCANITAVNCYARTIPSLGTDSFNDINKESCTLHVCKSLLEGYSGTYWATQFSLIENDLPDPDLEEGTYQDLTTKLFFEINEDGTTASIYHDETGVYENDNLVPHATITDAYTLPETVSADGETYYDVTRVEASAFANSAISGHLVIPAHITAIGEMAFQNCTSLTEVTYEYSDEALSDESSGNNTGTESFNGCTGVTTVNLYRDVTAGHDGYLCTPFCYNTSVATVNIGPRVTYIPGYMFRCHDSFGTTILSTINCYSINPPSLGTAPFDDLTSEYVINVPFGAESLYTAEDSSWSSIAIAGHIAEMSNAFAITTHANDEGTAYATFYNSLSDVELFNDGTESEPTELTAYVAYTLDPEDDGLYIIIEEIGNVIPANTGVVVETASEGTYLAIATENGEGYTGSNDLYGFDTAQECSQGNDYLYYLLSSVDGVVGFYWGAQDGAAFQCQAHRAYLALLSTAVTNATHISIRKGNGGEDTTGISSVENATEGASVKGIYTVQGVRVSNMNQPGLYIVDGKKVLVK